VLWAWPNDIEIEKMRFVARVRAFGTAPAARTPAGRRLHMPCATVRSHRDGSASVGNPLREDRAPADAQGMRVRIAWGP
jgi:hypothetical protein